MYDRLDMNMFKQKATIPTVSTKNADGAAVNLVCAVLFFFCLLSFVGCSLASMGCFHLFSSKRSCMKKNKAAPSFGRCPVGLLPCSPSRVVPLLLWVVCTSSGPKKAIFKKNICARTLQKKSCLKMLFICKHDHV